MGKASWGTPPIIKLLINVQKQMGLLRSKDLENQLQRANKLLSTQVEQLKKTQNGK